MLSVRISTFVFFQKHERSVETATHKAFENPGTAIIAVSAIAYRFLTKFIKSIFDDILKALQLESACMASLASLKKVTADVSTSK